MSNVKYNSFSHQSSQMMKLLLNVLTLLNVLNAQENNVWKIFSSIISNDETTLKRLKRS